MSTFVVLVFRSTLRQSRPNKAGLKCPIRPCVRHVRTCVRPSVCPQKVSLISMKFGMQVEVDKRVTHDVMQYDPIQDQGREPFKVGNPAIFKSRLLRHLQWTLATDH